jgi:endonuclease/exonuclease/phosphatase family metal-dependent hydrolase
MRSSRQRVAGMMVLMPMARRHAAVRSPRALFPLGLLALVLGCANAGIPRDKSIEATFPKQSQVTTLARDLRVVTFNVHMEPGDKIARALRSDPALRAADIIFLQEVERDERRPTMCSGACDLGRELGYHVVFAPGHAVKNGSHGVAVLSRAPITSAQVIELPYFNTHVNSGRRIALAATIDVDGTPITAYAVHLDNRLTVRERRTQMIPILIHAARQDTPIVMGGDFNTSHFTWLFHLIPIPTTTQDNHLEDLMRAHGFDTPVTDSGPTHIALAMRLDAIYTRGFETTKFAVSDAQRVSDHLALWAQMHLPLLTAAR